MGKNLTIYTRRFCVFLMALTIMPVVIIATHIVLAMLNILQCLIAAATGKAVKL